MIFSLERMQRVRGAYAREAIEDATRARRGKIEPQAM